MKLFIQEIKDMVDDMNSVDLKKEFVNIFLKPENAKRANKMAQIVNAFKGELQNSISQFGPKALMSDLSPSQERQLGFLKRKISVGKDFLKLEIDFHKTGFANGIMLIDLLLEKVKRVNESHFNTRLQKRKSSEKVLGKIEDKNLKKCFTFYALLNQKERDKSKPPIYQTWEQGLIAYLNRLFRFELERRGILKDPDIGLVVCRDWQLVKGDNSSISQR